MISKEELLEIARKEKLKPYQEEKKYIQTIVLSAIYSELGNELVFKGGTALFLYRGLNRFSEDLDFSQTKDFDIDKMVKRINDSFEIHGISHIIKEKKSKFGKNFLVSVEGPLYSKPISKCHVKIEISLRKDILLEPDLEDYIPKYSDVMPFSAYVMNLKEVAGEKVRAIMNRNYARDIYDLWFLIRKGFIPSLDLINKKMKYYNETFDIKIFKQKLEEKRDYWMTELEPIIIGRVPDFEMCKKEILGVFEK